MYGNDHVYGDAQACDDHVIFSRADGTPAYPAAMRQDAANIPSSADFSVTFLDEKRGTGKNG